MAYKSKGGCTPITAKIQKTTKGGMVTQPILNMGAPVKMKMSSPAKQTNGTYTNISFADYRKSGLMKPEEAKFYKGSGTKRVKTSDLPKPTSNKPKEKKKSEYTNLTFAQYRKSGLMKPEEAKFYKGSGTKRIKTSDLETKPTKEVKPTQKTKTNTAKSSGGSMTPYSVENGKGKIHGPKVSYDMAYEKAKKTKRYAGMSKADYIKEAKRQTKSFTETGSWDAKPKRKKVTAVETIKPKGIKPSSKEIKIETKIDVSAIKPKGEKAAKAKPTRSQKIRAKGEKALADGNKTKARRLRRRYDKQVAKETKKKGQAAGAIEVKKKAKKQSFNAVTNQSGYDAFKKAGGLSAWSKGEIEVK